MNNISYVSEIKYDDIIIHQQLQEVIDAHSRVLSETIINTKEQQIRKALIAMGWTPPSKKRKARKA